MATPNQCRATGGRCASVLGKCVQVHCCFMFRTCAPGPWGFAPRKIRGTLLSVRGVSAVP